MPSTTRLLSHALAAAAVFSLASGVTSAGATTYRPGPGVVTDTITRVPDATSGVLATSVLAWTPVADPGNGITTTGYTIAFATPDQQEQAAVFQLTQAGVNSATLPYVIGPNYTPFVREADFPSIGIGVGALFSDQTASSTTFLQVVPTKRRVPIYRVTFAPGSSTVSGDQANALNGVFLDLFTLVPACDLPVPTTHVKVSLVARTDGSRNTESSNALAQARLAAVEDLIPGPSPTLAPVTATSFGTHHPLGDNSTPAGAQLDRSVTIRLTITTSPSQACSPAG